MPAPECILKNPKISVIIPAYNARKFIGEAIESVLCQTVPPSEIIVVDDGSTDGTGDFVQKAFGNAVVVIRQENRGQASARNTGIKAATGNIFQFLDADDLLLPNKFERQLDFWQRNPNFDIVYCDFLNFQHGFLPSDIPTAQPRLQGNLLGALVLGETFPPHAPLVPRRVIEVVGGFPEDIRISPDQRFWVKCALHRFTFGYLPEVLVLRRRHSLNLTRDRIGQLEAAVNYFLWTLSLNLFSSLTKDIYRRLAGVYAELAMELAKSKFFGKSWHSLLRAQRYRLLSARLGSRRDMAFWLIDIMLWLNGVWEAVFGKGKRSVET